jgi:predicted nucleic acid-binding protein
VSWSTRAFCSAAPSRIIRFARKPHRQFPKLIRQRDAVFFCSQNVAEFWNVATRSADLNGLGRSHQEALQEVSSIERLLTLLPDVPAIYSAWKEIVRDHKIQGVKVYDARLVAVMNVYAVEGILTFNGADFKRYSNIKALHPSLVLA